MKKNNVSEKMRGIAAILSCPFFLGFLGLHRFYVGKIGTGILMIVFLVIFWPVTMIWSIVDFFRIITGDFSDKHGKKLKIWWD